MMKSLFKTLLGRLERPSVTELAPQRIHWTPELVARFWNGTSQTRLTAFNFSLQAGRSVIVALDHLLPRDGRILDFGAGDGDLVRLMCERGLRTAAYEPSEGRAQTLSQRLESRPGFLGVVGPESREEFDFVMMAEVIEHVLDKEFDSCLKRLKALTRLGGILAVTTPNNEDLDLGMAYCPVSNTLFHRWQHVRSFTADSLSGLLSRYGFEEIVTHQLEFNDALYVPYDSLWGTPESAENPPSHIIELRANRSVRIGGEANLLYIGRRVA